MVPTDPQVSEQAMQTIMANHQRQQQPADSGNATADVIDGAVEGLDIVGFDVVDVLVGTGEVLGAVAEGAGSLIGGIFEGLGGLG